MVVLADTDLSSLATVDDMPDTAHYYPQFIQKISGFIDDWYEQEMA